MRRVRSMPDRKPLGDEDIKSLVSKEITHARTNRSRLLEKQTQALEYFQGTMKDIPNEQGRSGATSRDLADVIGWMLPGIIRVFTASEHMAVAEPVGAEDEAWAREATDGLNYTFWKENDGYRIIYNATWDSLIGGNGVVKTWWDETPEEEISTHSGLSEDAYTFLTESDEIEVLAHSVVPVVIPGPEGQDAAVNTHDVKIKRTTRKGRTRLEAIPPEDYGIDGDAKTCADARFQYHKDRKTRSDLIEMGFPRSKVDNLGKASDDEEQQNARDEDVTSNDSSTELIDLYECYIRTDVDGDGVAETCRVMYAGGEAGGTVLDWEEWDDETPFDDIPCNPMPHRWEAQSIADETMDVQRIKTVLTRAALDNTYATNNPQRLVIGKIKNPEELFSPSFGGAIFGDADASVTNLVVASISGQAYEAIAYQDQVIERRTGVSRSTMALDPDALQNQTATAVQSSRDAAYSQIELVARNQAELGWKKVFRKMLKLEVKHQDQARTIRMRGKPVQIDPRHWNADMDITINVGLGTGSRDRDMAMLQTVKADQNFIAEQLGGAGMIEEAMGMLPKVVNTMLKSAEAAGIKSPEQFYPVLTNDVMQKALQQAQEAKSQPDPEQEAQKAKLQAEAADRQAKLEMDRVQGEQEIILKREEMQMNYALKERQLQMEMSLKERQLVAELQMKERLGFAQAASSSVHVGGEPG